MYISLIILLTLSTISTIMSAPVSRDEQWSNFKSTYEKNYGTEEDEAAHRAIFEANLEKIEAHNKEYEANKVTWKMGINKFTDLAQEEMKKFMGFRSTKNLQNAS